MEEKYALIVLFLAIIVFIVLYIRYNYKSNKEYQKNEDDFVKRLNIISAKVKNTFDKESATEAYDLIQYELKHPKYDILSEENKNRLHFEMRDLGGRIKIFNYYNGENNIKKRNNAG